MNADPSVVELITGASLPVQLVLIILALASIGSWALIFHKARAYKRSVSGVRVSTAPRSNSRSSWS